jgi:hypothetical protein
MRHTKLILLMEHNITNGTLFTCAWITAIVANVIIDLSPFWEFIVRSAPLGSTLLLYLINYDKINDSVKKILKKFNQWFTKE